jgi:vacuolar iron transporter family protein
LVSTFLLVAGVTGAGLSMDDILLTAIAGAIAGAFSIAVGEYIATKTQDEVFDGEAMVERSHIAHHRDHELQELGECFESIGIVPNHDNSDAEEVEDLRRRLISFYRKRDHAHLLAHMVLEFGIIHGDKRNPVIAGSLAFAFFLCGALASILPFVFNEDTHAAFVEAAISTIVGLFLVGVVKTWATRGNLWVAAIENLMIKAGGGAVAFGVGYAFEQLVRDNDSYHGHA